MSNISNNNNSLFNIQPAVSSSGVLTFTPASNINGSATVTLSISDNGGTTNGGDNTSDNKTFIITITAVNDTPTDISLSSTSVNENESSGTTVGALSSTDVDTGDSHTYTLVSGSGSTDNSSFAISGSNLQTAASFNFESQSSYNIRIRTTDSGTGTLYYEKAFTVTIVDVVEAADGASCSNFKALSSASRWRISSWRALRARKSVIKNTTSSVLYLRARIMSVSGSGESS